MAEMPVTLQRYIPCHCPKAFATPLLMYAGPAEQPPAYTSDTQHISIPHTGTTNATTATTASFQGSPPSAPDDPASPPPSPPGSQGLMGSGLRLQLPSNPFAARRRTPVAKQVLYRGKGMLLFRFVVRAKVFQLMGFLAAAAFASAVISTVRGLPGRGGQGPVDGGTGGWAGLEVSGWVRYSSYRNETPGSVSSRAIHMGMRGSRW